MRTKTKALAWAMAAAAAFAMAPATASAQSLVPEFAVNDTQTQGSHSISLTGVGRILSSDADSHLIEFDCSATASEPAVAIGTPQCYLLGADGRRVDAGNIGGQPGMKSFASSIYDLPRQRYRVCLNGHALFRDGEFMATQVRCSP
jgi:hypothetical protein